MDTTQRISGNYSTPVIETGKFQCRRSCFCISAKAFAVRITLWTRCVHESVNEQRRLVHAATSFACLCATVAGQEASVPRTRSAQFEQHSSVQTIRRECYKNAFSVHDSHAEETVPDAGAYSLTAGNVPCRVQISSKQGFLGAIDVIS